jgi:hypothetical protein
VYPYADLPIQLLYAKQTEFFILFPGIQQSGNELKGQSLTSVAAVSGSRMKVLTYREICTLHQTAQQGRQLHGTQTGRQNSRECSFTFRLLSRMDCVLPMGCIAANGPKCTVNEAWKFRRSEPLLRAFAL